MNYTVRQGDTLSAIGRQFGVPYSNISGYRSGNANMIYPGETLNIPSVNQSVARSVYSPAPAASYTGNTYTGNNKFTKGTPNQYKGWISDASTKYGVPTNLLSALFRQESGFNPSAVSPAGAVGIGQFMPQTAQGLGVNPYDPRESIFGTARHLSDLHSMFNQDWKLALAAYNAGPGNVQKYGGVPPFAETQHYVSVIPQYAGDVE